MTQQVEVRLTDGTREVFDADKWFRNESDGSLDVIATGDSASGRTAATFAAGQWSFVSKIAVKDRGSEKISVGNLAVDINDVVVAAELVEQYFRNRLPVGPSL